MRKPRLRKPYLRKSHLLVVPDIPLHTGKAAEIKLQKCHLKTKHEEIKDELLPHIFYAAVFFKMQSRIRCRPRISGHIRSHGLHNYSAAGRPGGVTEDRESLQPCELQEYVDSGDYSRIFVWYTFKFTLA